MMRVGEGSPALDTGKTPCSWLNSPGSLLLPPPIIVQASYMCNGMDALQNVCKVTITWHQFPPDPCLASW